MKNSQKETIGTVLFDSKKRAPLVLTNGEKEVAFEEVYATEREGTVYCILRPLVPVKGLRPNMALAFCLDGETLRAVQDAKRSDEIFMGYYAALRRAGRKA